MDTTYDRFKALPRGRRGDKTVVIVDEDVLDKLLQDTRHFARAGDSMIQSAPWLADPHAP